MSRRNRDRELAEGYSKEQVKKAHDIALKAYIEADGGITATSLCRRARVPSSWIEKWIRNEHWEQFLPGREVGDRLGLSKRASAKARAKGDDLNLTDQEWKFCYSYYKCRSAATAATRAGYQGDTYPARILNRPEIRKALELIAKEANHEVLLEACDIINMWAKIAFADMTDYVNISRAGVSLKPGTQVDGQVIQEVKEGRDGVTIKLADRMKALDRLSEYLGVTPEDKMKMAKQILAQRAVDGEGEDNSLTIEVLGV